VGPDGSGKTSVARALEQEPGLAVRYLYMGVSAASSDRLLPTTRLAHAVKRALGAPPDTAGPPPLPEAEPRPRSRGPLRSAAGAARGGLRLANRLAEEWYRQGLAWRYQRAGRTVVFDRHFFVDYHAYDVAPRAGRSLGRRVHGLVLSRLYPRPDLVVYLDAPPEVLLARKGEGSIGALERRRGDYLALADVVPAFAVVDATRPLAEVTAQVAEHIRALRPTLEPSSPEPTTGPRALTPPAAGRSARSTRPAPRVLVTDAERGSAVSVIRSLGRAGWEVTAASARPGAPGLRSRYSRHRLVYPDPALDAAGAAEAILGAATAQGLDLVIPVTDDLILPLDALRDRFPPTTRLAVASRAALDLVRDKGSTVALARELGLVTPAGRLVTTLAEAAAAAEGLGWPVVLKPQASRLLVDGSVRPLTVAFASHQEELAARAAPLLEVAPLLVQAYVPGQGIGVELLVDDGLILAAFQHRRLREVPVTGGASAYRESVALDPALLDQATRLMARLAWTGLAMVEFRVPDDGPAQLMEVNGRIWGSLPLAVAAGMDFPARLAELLCPGATLAGSPLASEYRVGLRAHNLPLEAAWILSVLVGRRRYPGLPFPPRYAAIGAALSLLDPRTSHDVLALADPLPGAAEIVELARPLLRSAAHDRH
jgi:predicted ATP-grasp superfamily ATP-dependent carboligase